MDNIVKALRKSTLLFFAGFTFGAVVYYFVEIRDDLASFIALCSALLTVYVAFYAIAWAKYEFHITRQSQQISVLAALCATDKRKAFAPSLAEMTRKKLPKHPTLQSPGVILHSLCASQNDEKYLTEDNPDTINMVASILLGFNDWEEADLARLNLPGAYLWEVNLSGAYLGGANLNEATLYRATLIRTDLSEASLIKADLTSANLNAADLSGAKLMNSCLIDAGLQRVSFNTPILLRNGLHNEQMRGADLSKADLMHADLRGANLSEAKLDGVILDDVFSLFETQLPPDIKETLLRTHPDLFAPTKKH